MLNKRPSTISLAIAAASLTSRSGEGLGAMTGSAPSEPLKLKWTTNDVEYWRPPCKPYVRDTPKQSRNSRCACGSGKKYKRCCGQNGKDHRS